MQPDATRILAPNRDDLWGEVHKKRAIMLPLPSVHCGHSPIVLHALASGKVTWQSDNSVSAPASLEGAPPRPPQPSQDLHVGTTVQPLQPPQPPQPQHLPPPSPQTGSQLAAMVDGWSVVPPPSSQPQAPSIAAQDLPPPQGGSEPDLKRGYLKVTQPGSGRHGTPSGVPGVGFGLGW